MLTITDPTIRGVIAAGRMKPLMKEIRTHVDQIWLIVNRVVGELPAEIVAAVKDNDLDLLASIPADPNLALLEITGQPSTNLPSNSPLQVSIKEIINKLGLN
jgi:CO dehydrogenase maturation factor